MKKKISPDRIILFILFFFIPALTFSQKKTESLNALLQKVQNPVSNLISVPFQDNTSFELGDHGQAQNVLNIQPVTPFSWNKKYRMVIRTILPIITQPNLEKGNGTTNGVGDISSTFFLSPKEGKITWGLGPVFSIPTGTAPEISNGKWCIGPSGVLHYKVSNWVLGGIMNNIWSFAGQGNRDEVSTFLFQPFINYNIPDQWYLAFSPIITANWKAHSGQQWIVPLGLSIGKVFNVAKQPMNASISAFGNVEKPDIGPAWSTRIQIAFLFPQ